LKRKISNRRLKRGTAAMIQMILATRSYS
jgi:hypothetical protein